MSGRVVRMLTSTMSFSSSEMANSSVRELPSLVERFFAM